MIFSNVSMEVSQSGTRQETIMIVAATAGFFLGLSLILAIGAQNAFILRQGLRREHVLPLVLTCAISDAILIAAGVAGFAHLEPALEKVPLAAARTAAEDGHLRDARRAGLLDHPGLPLRSLHKRRGTARIRQVPLPISAAGRKFARRYFASGAGGVAGETCDTAGTGLDGAGTMTLLRTALVAGMGVKV